MPYYFLLCSSNLCTYKGKLLARKDNIIYYGNPEDDYLIMMNITGTEDVNGFPVTSKVTVSLQTNTGGKEKVIIILENYQIIYLQLFFKGEFYEGYGNCS